jgi:hypothetical protein
LRVGCLQSLSFEVYIYGKIISVTRGEKEVKMRLAEYFRKGMVALALAVGTTRQAWVNKPECDGVGRGTRLETLTLHAKLDIDIGTEL